MFKIKKAIIPAAGLGTRFLPATKAMAKEMLPIVDKPTIQYIVEEAIQSGIEDLIIVTGKGKRSIEDHFDYAFELEQKLISKGKTELLEKVRETSKIEIHYIRQKEPKGLGHAIWSARKHIGDEPFGVLLGDDIVESPIPCLQQLINQYENLGTSVVGVQRVPMRDISRYGVIGFSMQNDRIYRIDELVEKPSIERAPSNLAIMGRYVLTPNIFDYLSKQKPGTGGEIQLTDAIESLNKFSAVHAYDFEGKRYDVGEKLGFVLTNLDFAMKRNDLREQLLSRMRSYVEESKTLI